jgi:hypothetical protein
MGDVEEDIDRSLLTEGLPHVDLLKVAHHGSRTATTQAFVDAVRPAVAVASAGAGNPYGHPARATLDRLAASGARVLRTDRDGSVVVGFEAAEMTVRTEGGRPTATPRATPAKATATRATTGRATTFLCAIPVTALVPIPQPPTGVSHVDPAGQAGRTAIRSLLDRSDIPPGLPPRRTAILTVRVRRRRALPDRDGPIARTVPQVSHVVLACTDRGCQECPTGLSPWLDPDQLGLREGATRRQRIRHRLEERDPEGAAEERLAIHRAVFDPMGARIEVEWRRATVADPGIGERGRPATPGETHAEQPAE